MSRGDYRLSYRALCFTYPRRESNSRQLACKARALPLSYRGMAMFQAGRDDTIRTCNLLDPNQARYSSGATSRWHGWGDSTPQLATLEIGAPPVELHPYRAGDEP